MLEHYPSYMTTYYSVFKEQRKKKAQKPKNKSLMPDVSIQLLFSIKFRIRKEIISLLQKSLLNLRKPFIEEERSCEHQPH